MLFVFVKHKQHSWRLYTKKWCDVLLTAAYVLFGCILWEWVVQVPEDHTDPQTRDWDRWCLWNAAHGGDRCRQLADMTKAIHSVSIYYVYSVLCNGIEQGFWIAWCRAMRSTNDGACTISNFSRERLNDIMRIIEVGWLSMTRVFRVCLWN